MAKTYSAPALDMSNPAPSPHPFSNSPVHEPRSSSKFMTGIALLLLQLQKTVQANAFDPPWDEDEVRPGWMDRIRASMERDGRWAAEESYGAWPWAGAEVDVPLQDDSIAGIRLDFERATGL